MSTEKETTEKRRRSRCNKKASNRRPPGRGKRSGGMNRQKGFVMTSISDEQKAMASVFAQLAEEPRWINWCKKWNEKKQNWDKVPYSPLTSCRVGSNNPAAWGTYTDAHAWAKTHNGTGIGIILGGGIAGIDIDHCRNPQTGELSELARGIVDRLDSYTEVSPSGGGVHILVRIDDVTLPWNRNKNVPSFEDHAQEIEIYTPRWDTDEAGKTVVKNGRYFTFTGRPLDPQNVRPIAERTDALCGVMMRYPAAAKEKTKPQKQPVATLSAGPESMSDAQRWQTMFAWKNGAEIRALYSGDASAYRDDNHPDGDHSRADLALCNHIAFATRHETADRAAIIDRMFRESGLYRDKWNRDDYRSGTIDSALASHPYELKQERASRAAAPSGDALQAGRMLGDQVWQDDTDAILHDTAPLPDVSPGRSAGMQAIEPPKLFVADGAATYGWAQYHRDIALYAQSNGRKTGFDNIDEHGPFRPGLYCIGAISSLGKSTFCLQLADNLAAAGENVLIFSAEQDKKTMHAKSVGRYLFNMTNDPHAPSGTDLKSGVTGDQVRAAEEAYHASVEDRLRIIPVRSRMRPTDLDYTVRYYTDMFGKPPVVVVDYIQRLKPDNPRDMERTAMNRVVATMQDLVLDLGVTAIGISSLNRTGYLQPISFESFKESGDIEYDADVVWGLDLGCMSAAMFAEEKGAVKKRDIVKIAKREHPREVRLVCLKNRDGETGYDALFYYYPKHEYFEALTDDRIVKDDWGNVDFKVPEGRRSWRNLIGGELDRLYAKATARPPITPVYDNVALTGKSVTLTRERVREWSASRAQEFYITITAPEHRADVRRMLPSAAKSDLIAKLASGPRRFATYTDTPALPA